MKFPPERSGSVETGRAALLENYFEDANNEILAVIMFEHIEAVKRVREILSVEGVDVGFIGPSDLVWSMGVRPWSDDHEAAILEIAEGAKDVSTVSGIMTRSPEETMKRIE